MSFAAEIDNNFEILVCYLATRITDAVLFNNERRLKWDTVLEKIEELDEIDGGRRLVYFAAKAPPPIQYRDFLHVRCPKETDEAKIVVDYSTTDPKYPEKEGYVR